MTKVEKYEELAAMCTVLLEQGPTDSGLGICHSLKTRNPTMWRSTSCLFYGIVEKWPKFSGNLVYPIPADGTPYEKPADVFNNVENLWVGEQGELRRDLLEFVIEQCKKQILSLSFPRRDIGPFRALLVE